MEVGDNSEKNIYCINTFRDSIIKNYKRFYKTRSKIYSLNITEEQYEYKKNIIFIVLNL